MKLTALFVANPEGGYTGVIAEIPGVITFGETVDETRELLRDALEQVMDVNRELAEEEYSELPVIRESFELAPALH